MPEVTRRSPTRRSADGAVKRSSGACPVPLPNITLRTPLRSTLTGTAWSRSVISVTSDMYGNTRVTWPTTPVSSMTPSPASIPTVEPLHGGRGTGVLLAQAEQRLEPRILLPGHVIALRGGSADEELALQCRVLVGELPLGPEVILHVVERHARHQQHPLQRIEADRNDLADVLQIAVARIGE